MPKLQFERSSFLENMEIELTLDRQPPVPSSERIHDSIPGKERVRFDVTLSWRSPGAIKTGEGGGDVVNYAHVYHYIQSLAGTVQTLPLECILDKVCEIALADPRVEEVSARVSRLDVAAPGRVGVSVRKQTLRNRF